MADDATWKVSPDPAAEVERVLALIKDCINTDAEFNRQFTLEDWKLAASDAPTEAIGPKDDAFLALCAEQPTDPKARELRASYLLPRLPDQLDCSEAMTNAVLCALMGVPENLNLKRTAGSGERRVSNGARIA